MFFRENESRFYCAIWQNGIAYTEMYLKNALYSIG